MKQLLSLLILFSFLSSSFGRFRELICITPETEQQHKFKVSICPQRNETFEVKVTWDKKIKGNKVVQLYVLSNKQEPPERLDFSAHSSNYQISTQLADHDNIFAQIVLTEDLLKRSYLAIDYPKIGYKDGKYYTSSVMDGGYFYTIELPEYLRQINESGNTLRFYERPKRVK